MSKLNNGGNVTVATLVKICEALDCGIEEIMKLTTVCRTHELDANETKGSRYHSALVADSTRGPMTQPNRSVAPDPRTTQS